MHKCEGSLHIGLVETRVEFLSWTDFGRERMESPVFALYHISGALPAAAELGKSNWSVQGCSNKLLRTQVASEVEV